MVNYTPSHVYLLRSWHEDGQPRLLVENPHTGERHIFEHLKELNEFLAQAFVMEERVGEEEIANGEW